ncbi:hypothetical protein EFA69_16630 [Rufibacter immobilis]|uniref:Cupin domain-containing protein n=1 Tax=Rufibacter immobilis TaxID=1348778 RepID=A0A3M9MRA5_9BACT|nr:hypothetical protein [Rufibacter immobilis]RNI27737.1 hypothetical protein EFA69_16630 [Rufibacter immobilis]
MIKAYQLYADPEGNSRVQEGIIAEKVFTKVVSLHFKETPPGGIYDWHPAPDTQYVLSLTGTLEFTTSTGEIFVLEPGEVLIATDTTGQGHKWRMLGDAPWKRAYVVFERGTEINFQPV